MMIIDPAQLFLRRAVTAETAGYLSGREDLIVSIANRLAADEVSSVIHGIQGIGKTTIAWQVASILLGTSPKFARDEVLKFGLEKNFRVVFHRCRSDVRSVGDLLFNIATDSRDKFSFIAQLPEIFRSADQVKEISHKFKFNLLSFFSYDLGIREEVGIYSDVLDKKFDLISEQNLKRAFFEEVVGRFKSGRDDEKLIIFVDEMERPEHIDGMGEYLKDNDDIQFVFVGMAENIDQMISDHRSSGRKLAGGNFEVPLLSEEEIRWIYLNAHTLSDGAIQFTDEFLTEVVKYSGGMPWIAQHVGFQAVYQKVLLDQRSKKFVLDAADLKTAVRRTIEVFSYESGLPIEFHKVDESGLTGREVLRIIWENSAGLSEAEIRDKLQHYRMKRFLRNALEKLVDSNILSQRKGRFVFLDPVVRILARFYLEEDGDFDGS